MTALPSWLDAFFGPAPPQAELTLFAGDFATARSTYTRVGGRQLDMADYPLNSGGLSRRVVFFCDVQKSSGATSVEVRLFDVTHEVAIASTELTHAANAALTEKSSGELTVGASAGDIRDDIASVYEVQMKMNGGGAEDGVCITNARLLISYS